MENPIKKLDIHLLPGYFPENNIAGQKASINDNPARKHSDHSGFLNILFPDPSPEGNLSY